MCLGSLRPGIVAISQVFRVLLTALHFVLPAHYPEVLERWWTWIRQKGQHVFSAEHVRCALREPVLQLPPTQIWCSASIEACCGAYDLALNQSRAVSYHGTLPSSCELFRSEAQCAHHPLKTHQHSPGNVFSSPACRERIDRSLLAVAAIRPSASRARDRGSNDTEMSGFDCFAVRWLPLTRGHTFRT